MEMTDEEADALDKELTRTLPTVDFSKPDIRHLRGTLHPVNMDDVRDEEDRCFNAETIAAFEEGDAMLRGELPAKRFNSLDEMLSDLDSDD